MKFRDYISSKLRKSFILVSTVAFIILFLFEFFIVGNVLQNKMNKTNEFTTELVLNTELTNEWNYLPNKLDKFFDLIEKDNWFSVFGFDLYKNDNLIYRTDLKNENFFKIKTIKINVPNDKLVLDFRLNLSKLIIAFLLSSLSLFLFILGMFKFITYQMGNVVSRAILPLEKMLDHFSHDTKNELIEETNVLELEILKGKIIDYKVERDRNESLLLENEKQKVYLTLARQVAHDISSPLEVIKNINPEIAFKNLDAKNIYQAALFRLEAILEDLGAKSQIKDVEMSLPAMIAQAVQEKKKQYMDLQLDIEVIVEEHPLLQMQYSAKELMRVFSNLINNSIQAAKLSETIDQLKISIQVSKTAEGLMVKFKDNGKGFPKEILNCNFLTPLSVGKKEGQGLGLFHAYGTIKSLGGQLILKNDFGAQVSLIFSLQLPEQIIVIDDDKLTHLNWKRKALALKIKYYGFEDFNELYTDLAKFESNKNLPIFSDWNIGHETAKANIIKLHQLGFSNIHLISGGEVELDADLAFVKSSKSKAFPWG